MVQNYRMAEVPLLSPLETCKKWDGTGERKEWTRQGQIKIVPLINIRYTGDEKG